MFARSRSQSARERTADRRLARRARTRPRRGPARVTSGRDRRYPSSRRDPSSKRHRPGRSPVPTPVEAIGSRHLRCRRPPRRAHRQAVSRLRKQRGDAHRWYRRLPARIGALLGLSSSPVPSSCSCSRCTAPANPRRRHRRRSSRSRFPRASPARRSRRSPRPTASRGATSPPLCARPTCTPRLRRPAGTPNLEGFLFPATYELNAALPSSIWWKTSSRPSAKTSTTSEIRRAHELGVTPYGLLTIASMIEREAATATTGRLWRR